MDFKLISIAFIGFLFVILSSDAYAVDITSCQTISTPGTYYLNADISNYGDDCFTITSSDVIFDCQGHIIDGNLEFGYVGIKVSNSGTSISNITIRNCTIQEFYFGIYFSGDTGREITDSLVENVVFWNNSNGIEASHSYYLTIDNVMINKSKYWGVYFYYSENNILSNSYILDSGMWGVYSYSSSANFTNIAILNNSEEDFNFYFPTIEYCSATTMQNITGTGNLPILFINKPTNLENMHLAELILCNASYSNLTNITIGGFGNNGFYIYFTNHSSFTDINSSNNYEALYLEESYYNNFSNLNFAHNWYYAIHLRYSSHNIFKNIKALDNDDGLFLFYSSYNNFENLSIFDNYGDGIYLYYSRYNSFYNVYTSYNLEGISLYPAYPNTFINITALNNSEEDFSISFSKPEDCSAITMQNITGTGNLPILYYNTSVNLADMHVAELILCNASYSNLTNITIGGFGNNGFYIYFTNHSSFTDINSSNNYEYNIYTRSSYYNTFKNVEASYNSHEYGFYIFRSHYNTFDHIYAFGNNWQGIFLRDSSHCIFTNLFLFDNDQGILCSYTSHYHTFINITALNNSDEDFKIIFSKPEDCSAITMQNITGTGNLPILYYNTSVNLADMHVAELILCNASSSQFTNITVGGFGNNGIYVYFTNHSSFTDINSSNNYKALYLKESYYNNFSNLDVSNNGLEGIALSSSFYNTFKNINALNSYWYGIYMQYSSYNAFANASISNSDRGIYCTYSSYNTFNNFSIINSSYIGIDFSDSSFNTLTNSLVFNTSYHGIYFYYSDNFFYNNLFNNTRNVYGYYSTNYFNTTLAKGPNIINRPFIAGNVWAKPDGTGFSETCTDANHDGICDSSYDTGYGIDYAPLALSATYPLDPKIYVGNQLAWSYDGLYNTKQTINITNALKSYVSSQCSSFPCSVPITVEARSRGMLSLGNLTFYLGDSLVESYSIIVDNILLKDADITNITIISKDMKQTCSSNLTAPQKILRGMLRIFKIPCPNIPCSDLGDVLVETTCGIKAKLSEIWKENIAKVLKC